MSVNLQVRLKQIESLEHYISSSHDKVQSILDCFKWNEKDLFKDQQLITCSINPSHRVHIKSVDDHIKKCSLQTEGYDVNEEFLSEPLHDINSSILIDDPKKSEIISKARKNNPDFKAAWNGQDPNPKTTDRLTSTFSSDERAALYTYSVTNTIGPPTLPEFNTLQEKVEETGPPTLAELRAFNRDIKRRRIKYKSAYTNKKNNTEILRDVIDNQMDAYREWLVTKGIAEPNKGKCQEIIENNQSSNEQIATDCERSKSVVSKKSLNSSSSKSSVSRKHHSRDKYDSHSRRHDYKERRDSYRRHRSRERYRKYQSSRSKHSYERHRDGGFKNREETKSRYDH